MSGIPKILEAGHLVRNDRQQRMILGLVLLILNFFRVNWASATIPDFISIGIQLELVITGLFGWCPFAACKVMLKNKSDKII